MPSGKWRPFCLGLNVLTYTVAVFLCSRSEVSLSPWKSNEANKIEIDQICWTWVEQVFITHILGNNNPVSEGMIYPMALKHLNCTLP